jgi:hypothetical protein
MKRALGEDGNLTGVDTPHRYRSPKRERERDEVSECKEKKSLTGQSLNTRQVLALRFILPMRPESRSNLPISKNVKRERETTPYPEIKSATE